MGAEEVRVYEENRARWEQNHSQILRLSAEISQVAEGLRDNPLRFMVSNVSGGSGPGIQLSSNIVLDGDRWPSAKEILDLTNAFREVTFSIRNAWAVLSDDEKGQVQTVDGAIF